MWLAEEVQLDGLGALGYVNDPGVLQGALSLLYRRDIVQHEIHSTLRHWNIAFIL